MDRKEEIMRIFPEYMRARFEQLLLFMDKLQELRFGVNAPVRVLQAGRESFLSENGCLLERQQGAWYLSEWEINDILKSISQYSLYAFDDEICNGFLTVQGGHRIGVAGKVVLDKNGQIKNMTHIRFLNIRISHEVIGAADSVMPYLYEGNGFLNTLLISPPGCGKTTLLRDIVRQASDGNAYGFGKQVGIVDERSEIAGCFLGIPQNDVGIRTDVIDACPKVLGMMLLMRSMAPAIVAVDEIGSREDLKAIRRIKQGGSSILATIHGDSLEDRILRGGIFERYMLLEKHNGIPRVKQIFDREGKPMTDMKRAEVC